MKRLSQAGTKRSVRITVVVAMWCFSAGFLFVIGYKCGHKYGVSEQRKLCKAEKDRLSMTLIDTLRDTVNEEFFEPSEARRKFLYLLSSAEREKVSLFTLIGTLRHCSRRPRIIMLKDRLGTSPVAVEELPDSPDER